MFLDELLCQSVVRLVLGLPGCRCVDVVVVGVGGNLLIRPPVCPDGRLEVA